MHKHGHSPSSAQSATYMAWGNMKNRCGNETATKFHRYGQRGIVVCERWHVFANFLADMGERPPGMTLERNDVNGHYEPGNCRWATPKEQANNKTNNRRITHEGITLTVSQWAERIGISFVMLRMRLHRGWPVNRALSEPPRRW